MIPIEHGVARVEDAGWFVIIRDEIRGPFSADQMRTAAQKGLVQPGTSVRKGGDGDWFRAEQVKGLIPATSSATPPTLDEPPTEQVSMGVTPPPATDLLETPFAAAGDARTAKIKSITRRRRRRSSPWPVLIAAAAGVALLLGMLFWLSRDSSARDANSTPSTESDGDQK